MTLEQYRQLDSKKLRGELKNALLHYHTLLAEKAMMKLKKTSELRKTRESIARINTVLREKAIVEALTSIDTPTT